MRGGGGGVGERDRGRVCHLVPTSGHIPYLCPHVIHILVITKKLSGSYHTHTHTHSESKREVYHEHNTYIHIGSGEMGAGGELRKWRDT